MKPAARVDRSRLELWHQPVDGKSADLSVRWCSAYVRIDVARRAINNDPRFRNAKVLFVTGERREERRARAQYAEVERHPCTNRRRRVDAWRAVIDWSEQQVWDTLRRWRIVPHRARWKTCR